MSDIRKAKRAALNQQLELALHNGDWQAEEKILAELDRIVDIMISQCRCKFKGQPHWCHYMEG